MFKFDGKVKDHLKVGSKKGDIGIEIEMECNKKYYFDDGDTFTTNWKMERDGSLKNNGIEFVMRQPVKYCKVGDSLSKLKSVILSEGIEQVDSVKAGVHVHLNVQKLTLKEVMVLLACYYPLETVLTKFCGNNRESNLFCLRLRDADYTVQLLENFVLDKNIYNLNTDELRYSALNFQSLFKYGSIEFRAFGSTPDFDKISVWCDMIMKLKEYALKIKNPNEIMYKLSGFGGRSLLVEIFGEELTELLEYKDMEDDIMSDARIVQNLYQMLSIPENYAKKVKEKLKLINPHVDLELGVDPIVVAKYSPPYIEDEGAENFQVVDPLYMDEIFPDADGGF